MPSATVEDYIKRLYTLQQDFADADVPMGAIAEAMDVTPGTATSMIKKLDRDRLVRYTAYRGVRLTTHGNALALDVLRRHRLIEAFLVEVLGVDWSEVHEEAERLEHAISPRLLEHIDRVLGHPQVDPHGDPIPRADGSVANPEGVPLNECPAGVDGLITRILIQSEAFLRFIDEHGLRPGIRVRVLGHDEAGDTCTVRTIAGEEVTLGSRAAANLVVAPIDGGTASD